MTKLKEDVMSTLPSRYALIAVTDIAETFSTEGVYKTCPL